MQIIKPQRIAILYKAYEHLGRFRLAVTAAIYFPFRQPEYLLPEVAMWKMLAVELGKDAPFDLGMPKPRGEVLVVGSCFAPDAAPVARASVRLCVGDPGKPLVDKRLNVFGDRRWQRGLAGLRASDPVPFVAMPIDYAHAFGGPDYPENPLGKGEAALPPAADGSVLHPLPNVEDATFPILSPDDRPPPAGFAPLDFAWPQRSRKAGTYDSDWLRKRFPAYADDMDTTMFNAAPRDQWLDAHFDGDEAFSISGMHPEIACVEGRLPAVAVRCLVRQRRGGEQLLREVGMRPETLWLIPQHERAVLVYRGDIEITTDDAEDISCLMLAAEGQGAARSTEYYAELLEQRLDPEQAALLALRDDQLLPPQPTRAVPYPDDSGVDHWIYQPKGLQMSRMRRKMAADLERAKLELRQLRSQLIDAQTKLNERGQALAGTGADIAAAAELSTQLADVDRMLAMELPPEEAPTSLEDLPELKKKLQARAREAQIQAEADIASAEQRIRASLADASSRIETAGAQLGAIDPPSPATLPVQKLDYDGMIAAARRDAGGPPKPFAARVIDEMRAGQRAVEQATAKVSGAGATAPDVPSLDADIARIEPMLYDAEQMQAQVYRKHAQMMLPAMSMSAAASEAARQQVLAALAAKRSMAGVDLTGADLSGLDLGGIDLRDALLEGADFSGSNLAGADLSGAVLVRTSLRRTLLTGTRLVGANLGFAELGEAVATDADLSGAILSNAGLGKADFSGAKLDKADLLGARLAGANLSRISAPEANFINVDLSRPESLPSFDAEPKRGPDLDMSGASFAGANIEKARFINCIVEGIDFSGANLGGAVFVGARGDRCNFRAANMANVRMVSNCSFADCDFSGAVLDRGNLRGTNLANGNFSACSALGADFSESRLTRSRFHGARARGARFAKADLTLAEMQGIDLMEGILQKATLHGTRLNGGNLFGADLLRIKVDNGTDFTRANLVRTLDGAVAKK